MAIPGAALAGSILQMALIIGANDIAEEVKNWMVSNDPSIYELKPKIYALIDAAARKGDSVLRKITSRLEAIVLPFGISDAVKGHIIDARRKLEEKKQLVDDKVQAISKASTKASAYTDSHEVLSTSGKLGIMGSVLRNRAKQSADEVKGLTQDLSKIEETL